MEIKDQGEYLRAKIRLLELQEQETIYRNTHKIEFWQPLPHQARALEYFLNGKKTVVLQGGNRIGKTVFWVNVVGACCLGYRPWDRGPTPFGRKPIRCRVLCVDWETAARDMIIPAMKEWFPVGSYVTKKNNVGVEATFFFPGTGSVIELVTHVQETKQQEGWSGHIAVFDEPPPRDKYIANKRGLVDYGGVAILSMTAVYESWILDEIVLKQDPNIGAVTEVPMRANTFLKEADIKDFESSLTEDEKKARVEGGWLQLQGLVYKEFSQDKHVVAPFEIPTDWPVVACIDIHLSIPQAVGFYAVDKFGRHYAIDEIWQNMTPEDIADAIIRKKKTLAWNIRRVYIDPLAKGDSQYMKNRVGIPDSFSVISDKLRAEGIVTELASKDKHSGILAVKHLLEGPNKMPGLFFFSTCRRHIWEIMRYNYTKEGELSDENDHFMENLYRFILTGTRYLPPDIYTKKLQYARPGLI